MLASQRQRRSWRKRTNTDTPEGEADADVELQASQRQHRSRRKMTDADAPEGEADADVEVQASQRQRQHWRKRTDADVPEGELDADVEVQASPRQRGPRRKRTETKWPEDKIVVTELTEVGMPKEAAAKARMTRLAGLIARQRIRLYLPKFSDLTNDDKSRLFKDCVQPWLEFAEGLEDRACKKIMQMVAKCWRTHKSYLVRRFVSKGLNATVKHSYIPPPDWEKFLRLKQSEHAMKQSAKFKKLRARSKHDHYLGTGGYAGKVAKWEEEDGVLAAHGIPNPWDQFPGRSRNFMRARGKLVLSEGNKAEIVWGSPEADLFSQELLRKKAQIESSGDILVRDKDLLTLALGQPEQTGRIRGLSSSIGWKFWPDCTDMYRKRRPVDMEELKEQVKLEITEKVTNDIIARLRAQGVIFSSPSNTRPSAGGKNSASASDTVCRLRAQGVILSSSSNTRPSAGGKNSASASDAVCNATLDKTGGTSDPAVHKACTLVLIDHEGFRVEVAMGKVWPNKTIIHRDEPVEEGYAVVLIDHVYPEHVGWLLKPPSNKYVRTLGEAMYKRLKWRREWIVVRAASSAPMHGFARSLPVVPNVSPLLHDKAYGSTVTNCSSMAHLLGKKESKLRKHPTAPQLADHIAAKSDTRFNSKVVFKQKQQQASRGAKSGTQPDQKVVVKQKKKDMKSSKSAPAVCFWGGLNPDFIFGQPMLPPIEVANAGPGCVALHTHYMEACAQNRKNPYFVMTTPEHFLHEIKPNLLFPVGFEDMFDLFTLNALETSILRCLTL